MADGIGVGDEVDTDDKRVPLDSGMHAFTRDPGNGSLSFSQGLCDDSIGQGAGGSVDGFFASQDVAASPDGAHLYSVSPNL